MQASSWSRERRCLWDSISSGATKSQGHLWLVAHLCLCFLIVKIRVIIRNDWWSKAVIFIFFKLHLGACLRTPDKQLFSSSSLYHYKWKILGSHIPKHLFLPKCEPCYFCIFQEWHCSEKFQMKEWYETFFLNISNDEFLVLNILAL